MEEKPEKLERIVTEFSGEIARTLTFKFSVVYWTIWSFFWGILVLVTRAGLGTKNFPSVWGLAGIPLLLALAYRRALRQAPSKTSLRGFLDKWGNCGGLLLASEEVDLRDWWKRIPEFPLPQLEWRFHNHLLLLFLSLIFVFASIMVPNKYIGFPLRESLDVSVEAAKISAQIETLEKEGFLPEKKAEELKK